MQCPLWVTTRQKPAIMSEEGSETDIAPRRLNVGQVPEAESGIPNRWRFDHSLSLFVA
jgi:hypothetical protein